MLTLIHFNSLTIEHAIYITHLKFYYLANSDCLFLPTSLFRSISYNPSTLEIVLKCSFVFLRSPFPVITAKVKNVHWRISNLPNMWDSENKDSIILTIKDPLISESCIKIKIKLNFYFHTSLWCFKRFYESLKGLHKTFWGTTKKCENKNLT